MINELSSPQMLTIIVLRYRWPELLNIFFPKSNKKAVSLVFSRQIKLIKDRTVQVQEPTAPLFVCVCVCVCV